MNKIWWLVFPIWFATADSIQPTTNNRIFQFMITDGGRYVWYATDSALWNWPPCQLEQFSIQDSITTDNIYSITPTKQ